VTPELAVRSVSACFPCFNDARTIASMVTTVDEVLAPLVEDVEIIVVDDGSSDDSLAVLRNLQRDLPRLVVIEHGHNRGYGAALISAFAAATKEWIFYTDGDGQYDAGEVTGFIDAARPDIDLIQGYKIGRGDPCYRKVIGRVYHHVVKLAFGLPGRDTDCDFRLFRRRLVVEHPLTATSGVICVELMHSFHRSGARWKELPVHHYFRPHGQSQFFRLPQLWRAGTGLVVLWWRLIVRGRR